MGIYIDLWMHLVNNWLGFDVELNCRDRGWDRKWFDVGRKWWIIIWLSVEETETETEQKAQCGTLMSLAGGTPPGRAIIMRCLPQRLSLCCSNNTTLLSIHRAQFTCLNAYILQQTKQSGPFHFPLFSFFFFFSFSMISSSFFPIECYSEQVFPHRYNSPFFMIYREINGN